MAARSEGGNRVSATLLLIAWTMAAAQSSAAGEPARQFLEALRGRGYFDQALEYLEQMSSSPLAPAELKETLVLEKGVILIEASRLQRDRAIRQKNLDDAQQLIQQFIDQRSDHPRANSARGQLGNLIVERARMGVEQAKKSDRVANLAEARKLYEQAFQVFSNQRETLKTQLAAMPKFLDDKDPQQRQLAERRDQLRTDYLQTLLLAAAIREEMTETVEPTSKEYRDFLTEAAGLYGGIYNDYRIRIAGLYARMYEARCMQKLQKFKDAQGYLGELLDQPDTPDEFRVLKTKALKYAMECWLDPSEKKYIESIRRGTEWIAKARPTEDRHPDWLVLRLYLARALAMQAEEVKQANPADRSINNTLAEARRQASFVAKYVSDYQAEAQALVARLGGPDRTLGKGEAKTFADARNFGKDAVDAVQSATLLIQQLPARIAAEQDAAAKSELQKQWIEAQQSLVASQQQAMDYFQAALRLADQDTSLNDLNTVRYFLAYLYFAQERYFEAALTGEFVARRYPDHSAARQCAKIAMASYLKLYSGSPADDKRFETDHVVAIAEYLAATWPDQPEAEEALGTLVPFMINTGQLDRAQAFLDKIPESSSKRGEAELKTGQALWASYLQQMQEVTKRGQEQVPSGGDIGPRTTELDALRNRSLAVLKSGYSRVQQSSTVDRAVVLAVLSLAQALVESEQPLDAIAVLENEKLGPLKLVQQNHPAAAEPAIVEESYKAALRAYLGGLNVAPDRAVMLAKAQETMDKMKTAIGAATGGHTRLVAVFISLARSLEEQLKSARPEGRTALSQGIESFLRQIRAESTDFSVLNWVAETFMSLGAGFETAGAASPESTRYYGESKETFDKILKETNPDPQMRTQVQVRLAAVSRKQRDFKTAIDTYVRILTDNLMLINVQVEAARTYQQWAAVPTKEALYGRAIGGHYPGKDGKNILWGWGRIAQVTARHEQFRDTFHEANVNLAWCRLLWAEKQSTDSKDKLLTSAWNGIAVVYRLYPDLGGASWTRQYDAVARRIQQAKGQPASGLQALAVSVSAKPQSP